MPDAAVSSAFWWNCTIFSLQDLKTNNLSVMILYLFVYLLLEISIERAFVKFHVCADELVGW